MSDNAQLRINDKEAQQQFTTTILKYPLDLGSQGESKYTIFNIYQYNKKEVNMVERKLHLGSVVLPIPAELSNTDSLNYEEFSAPLIQAAYSLGSADNLSNAASNFGGVAALAGAQITTKLGGQNLINQVAAIAGQSINPRNTNIFKNPSAREHRYSFKMIAKSENESIAIRQIVNKFRYHAYPEISPAGESIYLAPDLFVISFKTGDAASDDKNSYLFHPLPSALVALSVSYNGTTAPIFFRDSKAPVEVTVQLVFREMELDNKTKLQSRYSIDTPAKPNNKPTIPIPKPSSNRQIGPIENRFGDYGDAVL